jgi:hypothetical protein
MANVQNVLSSRGVKRRGDLLYGIAAPCGLAMTHLFYAIVLNQHIPRSLLRGGFSKKWPKSLVMG